MKIIDINNRFATHFNLFDWLFNRNSSPRMYISEIWPAFQKLYDTIMCDVAIILRVQQQQNERDTDSPKTASAKKQESKSKEESLGGKDGKGKGGGWLGGILTKLSLRPPNQMILPDDKNPSVSTAARKPRADMPTLL